MIRGARIGALMLCVGACNPPAPSETSPAPAATPTDEAPQGPTGRDGDLRVGSAFSGTTLRGTADGLRNLGAMAGEACPGVVLDQGVNHVVHVGSGQPLTFSATPEGVGVADLVIAVRDGDGTWSCADDGDGLDPVLARRFDAGAYELFVGTRNDTSAPYTLSVAAGLHTPDPLAFGGRFPAPIVEGTPPERTTDGTFGGVRFGAGDGQATLAGQAGGPRSASAIGPACLGEIAQTPDHVVELTAPMELMLRVLSDGDTTLAVQGPNGLVLCADDDDGLNPIIRHPLDPGRYSVYVGSYAPDENPSYTLSVSR